MESNDISLFIKTEDRKNYEQECKYLTIFSWNHFATAFARNCDISKEKSECTRRIFLCLMSLWNRIFGLLKPYK